jgi:hypothetical protein
MVGRYEQAASIAGRIERRWVHVLILATDVLWQ